MSGRDADRLARAALSRISEPGHPLLLGLVAELGARRVYDELRAGRDDHGVREDTAARLSEVDPDRELAQASRLGIRFVVPGDEEWPAGLDDLGGAGTLHERGGVPIGLWVRGPVRLDQLGEAVAIVGSRSSTTYGDEVAREIAWGVARARHPVVSGAAFGIDQAAHRGALAVDGATVAVLACGVDVPYPRAHAELLAALAEQGAVVSEAPPGCAPQRIRFLARNRLIAALSRGTVVVEAATRSGALNTSNWAERLSRVVMGVPGPVTSASSGGVHQLLRRGAALVTRGEEVLELVGESGEHLTLESRGPTTPRDVLTIRQQQILDAVPKGRGAETSSIGRVAGLGPAEVAAALRHLDDVGLVQRDATGWRLTALAHP